MFFDLSFAGKVDAFDAAKGAAIIGDLESNGEGMIFLTPS